MRRPTIRSASSTTSTATRPSSPAGHGPHPPRSATDGTRFRRTTGDFITASQVKANAGRRVIVSNEKDFFEDFLSQYSNQIPVFSGSFGNEWDLYTASLAEVTANFRRQVEKLRSAEALATVASLHDASFMVGRDQARDRAFVACGLYYEHDWTGDGPVSRSVRAQFQRNQLDSLSAYVNPLYTDALASVASRVSQPGGSERHMVFNPLSWVRSDIADLTSQIAPPLHVMDVALGTEVCSQILSTGATTLVRVLADNVPPVGYRVFEVRAGAGQNNGPAATVTLPSFDNGIYAVTLGAHGNITSLIDHKDADRQLVDVAGGGSIHDLGSGTGTAVVDVTGPVYTTLKVVAGGTPTHETRVTLYAGVDRVDVEGRVTQNFSTNVGYTSKFNLAGGTMRHEEVGMIARVARAADGGDYADENARTDYLTFDHFVDLSQAGRGVTVSNWDSPFFQAGASTPSFLDSVTPSIRAVVGMQVDGTTLGMLNQGGDTGFLNRFSLRTHGAYDQAAAMRFALEHQNPLVAARVTGSAGSPLPADHVVAPLHRLAGRSPLGTQAGGGGHRLRDHRAGVEPRRGAPHVEPDACPGPRCPPPCARPTSRPTSLRRASWAGRSPTTSPARKCARIACRPR